MMDPLEDPPDRQAAKELIKDAQTSATRYSSLGLAAFLPAKRPPGSAPKPNTRFLKHLLRDTENHNAALLAQERLEADARKRELNQKHIDRVRDELEAKYGQRGAKRRRSDESDSGLDSGRRHRHRYERTDRNDSEGRGKRRHGGEKRRDDSKSRIGKRESETKRSSLRQDDKQRSSSREHGHRNKNSHRSRRRERSRSPEQSRSRSRSRSPKHRHRQRAHDKREGEYAKRSVRRPGLKTNAETAETNYHKSYNASNAREETRTAASDSDPLEAIIGPLLQQKSAQGPKPNKKGRGAFTSSSAASIDSHFNSSYDPSLDVHPDPDTEDDWDQALEAMRDRQRWQQIGADRLRTAGFTEQEVERWEKGGEKDESDVRWSRKGEGREWDRGKVVNEEEDSIELKPEWGRLKGT